MLQAYQNIFKRCGLPVMVVEADSGAIGGKDSREFMVIAESGEDEIIYCIGCNYAANVDKAVSVKGSIDNGRPLPVEEVATPGMGTIEEVAGFLEVPRSHTLKAVFYIADGEMVFVVIRGDLAVNEIKLNNILKATDLRMASEAEVIAAGIVAGAASPVGFKGIKVIADDSVTSGTNFVAGGNKPDTQSRYRGGYRQRPRW
jgi:prolyl-tRNA synthetase